MQYPVVLDVARSQFHLITRKQVIEIASKRTLERYLQKRLLFEVAPCVYSPTEMLTWRQQLQAGWMSHPEIMVSHRSAARLWDFAPVAVNSVEFVADTDARPVLSFGTVHQSNLLPLKHKAWRDGIALTHPSRTLIDVSAVWPYEWTVQAIGKAVDKGLVTISELRRTLEQMRRRGRRRTTYIDAALESDEFANPKTRSGLEREAWAVMMRAGIPLPVAQYPIPMDTYTLHPDFCYPDLRLAIELDSYEWHTDLVAFHADKRRDATLSIRGWRVERFSKRTLDLLVPTIQAYHLRAAG